MAWDYRTLVAKRGVGVKGALDEEARRDYLMRARAQLIEESGGSAAKYLAPGHREILCCSRREDRGRPLRRRAVRGLISTGFRPSRRGDSVASYEAILSRMICSRTWAPVSSDACCAAAQQEASNKARATSLDDLVGAGEAGARKGRRVARALRRE